MIIKHKSEVFVTFQIEGTHCYPAAATNPTLATGDWDDVSFLASPHRHMFNFKLTLQVFHNDRDLEFIQVKRQCLKWYNEGTLNFNHKSCEMLADELAALVGDKWPGREIKIEVNEDGENGCVNQYV